MNTEKPVSVSRFQGCFECTDWTLFMDSALNMDEWTDTVCSYISFCEDSVVPKKYVKVYANDKPWVTSSLRHGLFRYQKTIPLRT